MNITVIGTGYVGLVTGTCFAETGNNVICVDNNPDKISQLKNNKIPIYEPDLDNYFERNVKQNRLTFTTDLKEGVEASEIIMLALPTPPGENGSADLSYVLGVAEEIGKIMKDYKIIINKSTVPVGTAEKVKATIRKFTDVEFDVVSNPEFLREGLAVDDFMKPERIVIGTSSEKVKQILSELYTPFVRQGNPIIFMDEKSAELTKYAANSFLATKITFMNEISNICEKLGANVDLVRIGIGSDSRIGKRFLFPGIGYGGSCFPKDVKALTRIAEEIGYEFEILNSVMRVNENQKLTLIKKLKDHFGSLEGRAFAIWGLSFKPDTDDIREAPSLYMIDELLKNGCKVSVFDPEALGNVKNIYGDKLTYGKDQYEILKDRDALLISTEWSLFRSPDFNMIGELLKNKIIFDGRNLFNLEQMKRLGFKYFSIGRKDIN
jgi:UDPglucose 6-dehydrogenase